LPLWNIRFQNKQGASLVELLVVCTIVVLLAGLCAHGLSNVQRATVRSELALLHSTCRYAQKSAIAMHQEQRIVLDLSAHAYTYGATRHVLHAGVIFGFPPLAKGPPAHPEALLTKPSSFVDNTIVCYPTGIISAGSLYLSNAARSCCYALSNGVSQVSYVRCYEYQGKWVLLH
jgi:type II secretory pathway pseudopilin PulG